MNKIFEFKYTCKNDEIDFTRKIESKVSKVPALAFDTIGVKSQLSLRLVTTPAAPKKAADRMIDPKFCGSSNFTKSNQRPATLGTSVRTGGSNLDTCKATF